MSQIAERIGTMAEALSEAVAMAGASWGQPRDTICQDFQGRGS